MEKELRLVREEIQALKAKAEILRSTLFAICAAQDTNVHDAASYAGAIHGAAQMAHEIQDALERLDEKGSRLGPRGDS